jgi:hypothetical protein
MDKVDEVVRGVKFLAPGIIVVFIFYMFSNVKLDEFAFLVFAAVAIIFISFVTDAFLILLSALIYGVSFSIAKVTALISPVYDRRLEISFSKAKRIVHSARLASQFVLSLLVGVLLVNLYEADSFYDYMRSFVSAPKTSQRDVLTRVTVLVRDRRFDEIGQRPDASQPCKAQPKDCLQNFYLRVQVKPGDIYEGGTRYFPTSGEILGFYLSPACAYRAKSEFEHGPIEKVSGAGVYISMSEVSSIEFIDLISSSCFAEFYPAKVKAWKP